MLAAVNGTFAQTLSLPNAFVVKVPAGTEEQAASSLAANPNVLYAEPNRIAHAYVISNDTSFGQLWGLRNLGQTVGGQAGTLDADIDAPEGWEIGRNLSSSVRVAVIDTGATTHPDFLQNIFVNPGESGGPKETNQRYDDRDGFARDVSRLGFCQQRQHSDRRQFAWLACGRARSPVRGNNAAACDRRGELPTGFRTMARGRRSCRSRC